MVLKGIGKQIGSDILVWAPLSMLDEQSLRDYLQGQKDDDNHLVEDFAFMSISYQDSLKIGGKKDDTLFMGPSQLDQLFKVAAYAVPQNFFDVVYSDYYVQDEAQDDLPDIDYLTNGDLDPVQMIYSNASLTDYPATVPNFNIKNTYSTTFSKNSKTPYAAQGGTEATYPCVIPSALASSFAVEVGDLVKL